MEVADKRYNIKLQGVTVGWDVDARATSCVSVDLWILYLFACCQLIIIVAVISVAQGQGYG